jgi:hypothetical protein
MSIPAAEDQRRQPAVSFVEPPDVNRSHAKEPLRSAEEIRAQHAGASADLVRSTTS